MKLNVTTEGGVFKTTFTNDQGETVLPVDGATLILELDGEKRRLLLSRKVEGEHRPETLQFEGVSAVLEFTVPDAAQAQLRRFLR